VFQQEEVVCCVNQRKLASARIQNDLFVCHRLFSDGFAYIPSYLVPS
jgi:hypothetical protein